jgi:hypothetical protein
MNREMPTLLNKFNFKSVIMEAILLENGIYIGVDTYVDKSLDDSKIQESKEFVVINCNSNPKREAILFGGRVDVYGSNSGWSLSVDGISIKKLCSTSWHYDNDGFYYAKVDSSLDTAQVTSYLNQMQQLGVDTFLANYKQSLEKSKEELSVICDKLESELSVQENEIKKKFLGKLRDVIILIRIWRNQIQSICYRKRSSIMIKFNLIIVYHKAYRHFIIIVASILQQLPKPSFLR